MMINYDKNTTAVKEAMKMSKKSGVSYKERQANALQQQRIAEGIIINAGSKLVVDVIEGSCSAVAHGVMWVGKKIFSKNKDKGDKGNKNK